MNKRSILDMHLGNVVSVAVNAAENKPHKRCSRFGCNLVRISLKCLCDIGLTVFAFELLTVNGLVVLNSNTMSLSSAWHPFHFASSSINVLNSAFNRSAFSLQYFAAAFTAYSASSVSSIIVIVPAEDL